jgi:hypothetical protein
LVRDATRIRIATLVRDATRIRIAARIRDATLVGDTARIGIATLVRDATRVRIATLVRDATRIGVATLVRDATRIGVATLVRDAAWIRIASLVRDAGWGLDAAAVWHVVALIGVRPVVEATVEVARREGGVRTVRCWRIPTVTLCRVRRRLISVSVWINAGRCIAWRLVSAARFGVLSSPVT